jgi:hypothetical protein
LESMMAWGRLPGPEAFALVTLSAANMRRSSSN